MNNDNKSLSISCTTTRIALLEDLAFIGSALLRLSFTIAIVLKNILILQSKAYAEDDV